MRDHFTRWVGQVLLSIFLFFFGLGSPALATIHNVKTSCGAAGNGSTNDTAAVNTCIGQLVSGDTLEFPAGTYVTSSQLTITTPNVTVDGSSNTATIKNTSSGGSIMVIGSSAFLGSYGSAIALSATANELATSFTPVSSLGVAAGDYIYIHQGGSGSSQNSGATQCDTSSCRGEILKVASVSGNTVTVTTALHDTYNPSVNAAVVQKLTRPLDGVTVQNITFDGGSSDPNYGLLFLGCVNCTATGVTATNVNYTAVYANSGFNNSWSNITVTNSGAASGVGGGAGGSSMSMYVQGNPTVNGVSISGGCHWFSGCDAFGFTVGGTANGTFTDITIDAAGTAGRPFKTTAVRYSTFPSLTVKNGGGNANGISLEYYSSHNTFSNCVVQDTAGGAGSGSAGLNTFGNFNQYNTFTGCTIARNGNVQIVISTHVYAGAQDLHNTIQNSTITGIVGTNTYGMLLQSGSNCIDSNTFTGSTSLSPGISSSASSNIGSGNTMNGVSSNLTSGACQQGIAPPTGLIAAVQ